MSCRPKILPEPVHVTRRVTAGAEGKKSEAEKPKKEKAGKQRSSKSKENEALLAMLRQMEIEKNDLQDTINRIELESARKKKQQTDVHREESTERQGPTDLNCTIADLRDDLQTRAQADSLYTDCPFFGDTEREPQPQSGTSNAEYSQAKNVSGYFAKTQQKIRKSALWPHAFLFDVESSHPDDLTYDQFLLGYVRIIRASEIPTLEVEGRLQHLEELILFNIHHKNWEATRSFHYDWLRHIELGIAKWDSAQQRNLLALQAAQHYVSVGGTDKGFRRERSASNSHKPNSGGQNKKSVTCWSYNNEVVDGAECKYSTAGRTCKKAHMCSTCADVGLKKEHRAKFDCPHGKTQ